VPPNIPDSVPLNFPAGTTVKYTRSLDDFAPSDGWAYTIYLNGLTAKFNKAASVQDPATFLIEFVPTDTASLPPGPYRFAERLVNSGLGETYDLRGDMLVIIIEPNVASSAAGAFQTFEERTLAVLEAAIGGNLTGGIQSYQISGRAVSKYKMAELMSLRGMFRAAVWRQQHPGQLGIPYKVVFGIETDVNFPPTWADVTGLDR
jgi:hypothetical protein